MASPASVSAARRGLELSRSWYVTYQEPRQPKRDNHSKMTWTEPDGKGTTAYDNRGDHFDDSICGHCEHRGKRR